MGHARVLVVEDELIVADDLGHLLAKLGYDVVGSERTGEGAVEACAKLRPDLVLMDITLRGAMDGVEAAARIRRDLRIPVVYLTAHTDEATLHRAKVTEPYGYVLKPFEEADVRSTLELAQYRAQAEGERRRSDWLRAHLAAIVESSDDAIISKDLDGTITTWNPGAQHLFGYTADAVIGKPVSLLIPPELADEERRIMARIRKGERVEHFTSRRLRKDGTTVDVSITVSPIRDAEGSIVGASKIVRDVTQQRRAQEARARLEQQAQQIEALRELDALKTRFINTAAHELSTPLTPLRLQVELFRSGAQGPLTTEQTKGLAVVHRNVERLAGLVADILQATRLQAGHLGMRPEPADIVALAQAAVDAARPAAAQRGVRLALRVPRTAPVRVDAQRIGQVLDNLLGNALKFTPRGGTVSVEVASGAGGTEVRVRDSGVGIEPDAIGRLFRPFAQLGNAAEGSGLGLYICKGIIELHGGRIWVESDGPGKGSVFTFALPTEAPDLPERTVGRG